MGKESMGFCFVILSVSYFIKYGDLHSYFFCWNYHGVCCVHGCIKSVTVCLYQICLYSFICCGHLNQVHFLSVVNRAEMGKDVKMSLW